jgi:hypothetical protein
MAADPLPYPDKPPISFMDLVAYTKKELDADTEQQARLQAPNPGELPRESQTGVTLDLSRKNIDVLPLEVIDLIKDRVERYGGSMMRSGRCRS